MPDWLPSLPVALGVLVVVVDLALRIAAFGIIPGGRKPSSGMAWLILILFTPMLGFVAFLLFGSTWVGRRRHTKQHEVNERIRKRAAGIAPPVARPGAPSYLDSVLTLNRNLGALPALEGNAVELFSDYRASIAAMTAEVERAERYVNAQYYITAWDDVTGPFYDALVRAAERGVTVRLLFDHLGSRSIPGYKDMVRRLQGTAIDWQPMLPVQPLRGRFRRPDLRNHRKILVVDGRVAFTGSQNLIEPGYDKPKNHKLGREWVELTSRVEGPVVAALNALFATDWFSERDAPPAEVIDAVLPPPTAGDLTCQVVPSGPGFATENNLRLFNTLLYSARHRISLTSPYFVPDESLLYAVTTAAQRGVEVELFVNAQADQFMVHHAQRSYYQALLESGVRIHLYPEPYILHSKHFTIDDSVAVLGSSNMDMRSFALNYEVTLMLLGEEVVGRMREVEDRYRSLSRELTLEEWRARPLGGRYVDNVMRLTAALQ